MVEFHTTNADALVHLWKEDISGKRNRLTDKNFTRTGVSRRGFTCNGEGSYNLEKDSEGKYILPTICVPRGM